MTEAERTSVVRNDAEGRYEIFVNDELAGFTAFIDRGPQRIFPHTELDDRFSGRGLSSILVHDALEDTREAGQRIVAVCPLVAHYIDKHDELADVVDPATPEILNSLPPR